MPTSKTNAPSFLTLPVEIRGEIYDHFGKDTLAKMAKTCREINREIDSVVDDQGKRARSPWDALRERKFPGIAVPESIESKSASVVYRTVEAMSLTYKKVESLKGLARCYRSHAEVLEAMPDMSSNFMAQVPRSQAEEAEKEAEQLLSELKTKCY